MLYSFIFANPESLIQNEKWRQMLQSDVYLKNIFAIVTDKAHVIPWLGGSLVSRRILRTPLLAKFINKVYRYRFFFIVLTNYEQLLFLL